MAEKSSYTFRHGAVIWRANRPIGIGFNSNKFTSEIKGHKWPTRHAEIDALLSCNSVTKGADLYVVRCNARGEFRNSKPCPMCIDMMRKHYIRRCFYSISDNEYGVMLL